MGFIRSFSNLNTIFHNCIKLFLYNQHNTLHKLNYIDVIYKKLRITYKI